MSTEFPADIRQRITDDFGESQTDQTYRNLLDKAPSGLPMGLGYDICDAYSIWRGNPERLDHYIQMCFGDTRDVMLAAEYETAADRRLVRHRDFNRPFDQARLLTE